MWELIARYRSVCRALAGNVAGFLATRDRTSSGDGETHEWRRHANYCVCPARKGEEARSMEA
ncbi:hypothetical protein J6590_060614 [Homalodisca vitripennis]|nr:hypothetical protein J6590_060614 [Homalodisca vitripennis]